MNIWDLVVIVLLLETVHGVVEQSFRERRRQYCRLAKKCKHREEDNYSYGKLVKISDVPGIQPAGYLVRIPFYVLAPRDAHIVFSSTESPNWTSENVYEVVIGGFGNNRTLIRRKLQDFELSVEYTYNVLQPGEPIKLLIEISIDGTIKVFVDQKQVLISKDDNVLPIKYFGFASHDNSLAEFFYGCEGDTAYDDEAILTNLCRYADATENEYKDFYKITDIAGVRPDGYIINFPFYLQAERDAHILLTTGPTANPKDNEYEFVVGGWGNTRSAIRRKQQDVPLRDAQQAVLSNNKWIAFLIQITTRGEIKLFRKEGTKPFKLVIEATDSNPLPVEYISFGSWEQNLVKFYFNCSFSFATPDTALAAAEPPLLEKDVVQSSADLESSLVIKNLCRYADATENEYKDFYKITDIAGVRSEGYIINFPFYIQAERDAHVLLTAGPKANREDNEYEFVIGGWGNTRTAIRRKQQDIPLRAAEQEVLSNNKWIAFLIQITTRGAIKVFRKEGVHSFKLVVEATDSNPLPVEYISFGSWEANLVKFYFGCSFSFSTPDTVSETTDHPFLAENERRSPIELKNSLCRYADATENVYKDFYKIADIPDIRSEGYIINFPFYVQAEKDAHVLLTTGPTANREDKEYEFVIGGWGNTRSVIRSKQQGFPLSNTQQVVLSKDRWTAFLIQITSQGAIKVFRKGLHSFNLLVEATDSNPLPVEYISFGSWGANLVKFYFNCSFSFATSNTISNHPLLANDELRSIEWRNAMITKHLCRHTEVIENEYNEFYKITDVTSIRPEGYIISFPFFVQAEKDAHILLTTGPKANREDNEYEFVLGGWGNRRTAIRRKQQDSPLRDAEQVVLSSDKWIAFLIQITQGGEIKIHRKEGSSPYKLVVEVRDSNPIPVEYISFGSWEANVVKFRFNCSFGFASPNTIPTNNALLAEDVIKSIELRNFLLAKCNFYQAAEYEYKRFSKIDNIENSSSNDYVFRAVVYIQGTSDSHILLTTSDRPNFESDLVYEFVIGGWRNSWVVIRKKKDGEVLAAVHESNIITSERPTKFLLEIANRNIRLYSQSSSAKLQPLIDLIEEDLLPIKYISFASNPNSLIQYFYNCSHIDTQNK